MSKLQTEKHGDVLVVKLDGRLDVQNSMKVEQAINAIIDEGETKLVFDLHGVEYLSSSGLRIFIATTRRLKAENGMLKLSRMSDSVKKIFEVVELYPLFSVYTSIEEAAASF